MTLGHLIANGTILPNGSKLEWDTKIKDILLDWRLSDTYISDHADLTDLLCK